MADNADIAQRLIEMENQALLSQINTAPTPFTGSCLNCYETIKEGVYCDGECAKDHEKRERVKSVGH